jgi:type I restriction enzyme, S subunit
VNKPWPIVQLDSVADIERESVQAGKISSGSTYVGLENITSDGEFLKVTDVEAGELGSSKFLFSKDHVLYGKLRPYLRKIARPSFSGICSTDIVPIRPGPGLDKGYLFHYLRTPTMVDKATTMSVGVNLPRLSPSTLAIFQIPLPPIEEQRRIAAILDKADEIRTKRRAALAQLDTLTQAIFLDLFGETHTDEVPLGDFADIVSGITIGRNLTDKKVETVPYLTVANVQDRRLNLKVVKTTLATEEEISRYAMQHHDILLTEGGDPDKLGRGCLWKNEIEGCIHQNHVFRVRMKTDALQPTFVSGLLSSPKGKRYFLRSAKQTTGIASINATQLRQFPVFLPSAETQENYRNAVEATSELEIRLNSALEAASEVFAILQRSLFNPTGDRI